MIISTLVDSTNSQDKINIYDVYNNRFHPSNNEEDLLNEKTYNEADYDELLEKYSLVKVPCISPNQANTLFPKSAGAIHLH